jgi:5-methylcytosine-specific restriction protein B
MRGADRARLVAMNYFVAPAREAAQRQVTIRAGDLHDMSGLLQNWANVCQALEGEKFQTLADVGPPARSGPVRSSTTEYTFALTQDENQHPMVDSIAAISPATNLILYGPPGMGKTYTTAAEAVRLCGEKVSENRAELMADYLKLVAAGRIEFVTFHQSMSYEEFIEGRQPTTGGDEDEVAESAGFRLETVQGIFKRIAKRAETSWGRPSSHTTIKVDGRQVFKMSIGQASNPDDAHLFEEAVDGGYTLLGFADIDWSDDQYSSRDAIFEACKAQLGEYPDLNSLSGFVQMPFRFRNGVRKGDIIIVSKGNKHFRAIGEVTGDYEFRPRPEGDYGHRRAARWLWIDRGGIPVNEIYRRGFHQQSIYLLPSNELNVPALERYMNSQTTDGANQPDQFVLIIDEINRANISKVFGELITLLEPDKRLAAKLKCQH